VAALVPTFSWVRMESRQWSVVSGWRDWRRKGGDSTSTYLQLGEDGE
jgi:hypothetical protein